MKRPSFNPPPPSRRRVVAALDDLWGRDPNAAERDAPARPLLVAARYAEAAALLVALTCARGSRTRAAETLGCTPRTVFRLLERHRGVIGDDLDHAAARGGWELDDTLSARARRSRGSK